MALLQYMLKRYDNMVKAKKGFISFTCDHVMQLCKVCNMQSRSHIDAFLLRISAPPCLHFA